MFPFGTPNIIRLEARRDVLSLARALEHRESNVRVDAIEALRRIGSSDAVAALSKVLFVSEPGVGEAAADALGRVGHVGAVSALLEALEAATSKVASAAADALVAIGDPAVPALVAAVGNPTFGARDRAIDALGRSDGNRAIPVLTAALNDKDPGVRHAAAAGLRRIGVRQPVPTFSGPLAERLDRRICGHRDRDLPATSYLDFLDRFDADAAARFERHQIELRKVIDERTRALSEYLMPDIPSAAVRDYDGSNWFIVGILEEAFPAPASLADIPALMVWRHRSQHLYVVSGPRLVRIVSTAGEEHILVVIASKHIDNSDYVKKSREDPKSIAGIIRGDDEKRRRQENFEVDFFTTPTSFDPALGIESLTIQDVRLVPWYSAVKWPYGQLHAGFGGFHNMHADLIAGSVDLVLEDGFTAVPARAEDVPEWRPWYRSLLSPTDRRALERKEAEKRLRELNVPLP